MNFVNNKTKINTLALLCLFLVTNCIDEDKIDALVMKEQPDKAPAKPSQIKEIENSVYEETSEFESADIIKKSKTLEIGKIYELSENWMKFSVTEDLPIEDQRFHLITVKGSGTIIIKMNNEAPYRVVLNKDYEMSYIPFNSHFFLGGKNDAMEIAIDSQAQGLTPSPLIKLELVDALQMEFNQNHRVVTTLVDMLRYRVSRPDLHLNKEGKEDRLQFILQSSLNNQVIMGVEEIAMYINKGKTFPTRSNYDFMATGNMGYGLIKSLSKGNKFYCVEVDCTYSVSIYVKDVDKVFFFPTVFANFSKIEFKKYLFLLEEVEGSKVVSYELDVPMHKGDWAFTIQPMEGNPRMFINPDKNIDLKLYKYKSLGKHAEEITITYQQSRQYKFSHQKFFVSFISLGNEDSVATFKFEVKKIKKNEPKFLKIDYAETGVVGNDEIVQYSLQFEVDEPEYIDFVLEHTAIVGKSILVLKECKDTSKKCRVTPEDLDTCQKYSLTSEGQMPNPDSPVNLGAQPGVYNPRLLAAIPNAQYPPQNNQGGYQQPYNGQQYQAQPGYQNYQPGVIPPNQRYQPIPQQMLNTSRQGVRTWNNANQMGEPPLENTQQGGQNQYDPNMYYPDQDLGSGIDQDQMINYQDIQAGQQNQQNYQPSNMNPNAVPPSAPSPQGGFQSNVVYDNMQRPITPPQNNLTQMRTQEMMDMLSDPKKSQKFINHMMENKDKELQDIFDYSKRDQIEEMPSQEPVHPVFQDPNVAGSQGAYSDDGQDQEILHEFENQQVQEGNQQIGYDLDKEVDPYDVRCVAAEGGGGEHEIKKLIMSFNCLGSGNSKKGESFEQLDPYAPYSNFCRFAIGVYGANQSKKYGGSFYSITGSGQLEHQELKLNKSSEVIVQEGQLKYLRLSLRKLHVSMERLIQAKVVAITGSSRIYFSRFNAYPDEYDNEGFLEFSNEHFMSVRTSEKKVKIPLDTKGQFKSLFISVQASNYTVLDFYLQTLETARDKDDKKEHLTKGKMIRRMLNVDDLDKNKSKSGKSQYLKNFMLEIDYEGFKRDGHIKVVLNSNVIGLHLCLQKDHELINLSRPCDVTSHTGIAEIKEDQNLEFGTRWAVGVVYAPKHKPKLPAEFSLIYFEGNDSSTHLKILNPGRSFSSHLKKGESVIVQINLLSVATNSLIILTSEDKSVRGEISLNKFDFTKAKYVLDNEKFALEINHSEEQILCRDEGSSSCIFFIKIHSASEHRSRFSLTYTFDDVPITIKEGHELFIPNKDPLYFLYDPNPLYPAQINLESDITEFVIYSRLVKLEEVKKHSLDKLLTELDFDYKTDIGLSEQLRIPQKHVEEAGDNVLVAYLIVPKFFANQSKSPVTMYSSAETTRVVVKSKISELAGFTQGVARLKKGEFRHYFFNVENAKDFSVVMTVHSGHADLYLNKGMFNLPTKKQYWKRRRGSRGEELLITPKMFKDADDIKGIYTVGVFAESNCRVSLFFLPSFKNLIKLKIQHMTRMEIKKGKDYYFEFFNKLPQWDMDLYAENTDIQISIMDYQIKNEKQMNILDMLEDDKNYIETFKFTKGSLPLKHHEESADQNRHYVVRVKALEEDAHVNLGIFDPTKPIVIPAHKRMILVGDPDAEYIYKVELTGDFEQVKLDVKLSFGDIEIFYSDNLEDLAKQPKKHAMQVPGSKDFTFKAPAKKMDIVIFSQFFVKVKTKKFSKFSLLVRGQEKFREIKDFESEIVYTLPKEDQFVYYYVSGSKAKTTKSLVFDVYMVNFYGDHPKFLYNPDDQDIELGEETKLLPMPRLDFSDKTTGEFRHIEMRPEVRKGYYIIQIPKNFHRLPIKISVGLNDVRSIEVNGVYRSQLPGGHIPVHKYSVYLPEKGEFRFLVDSCEKADIKEARLQLYMQETPITFAENLVEGRSFFYMDDRKKGKKPYMRLRNYMRRVFRGLNDFPGVLQFAVEPSQKPKHLKLDGHNKDYLLISEFKPANKDMFIKDYVNLWNREGSDNVSQFRYQWTNRNRNLMVTIISPTFREQLLIDYPNLKVVVVKYFLYIFDDPRFKERMELCGLEAIEEIPHTKKYRPVTLKLPQDFNKDIPATFKFTERELDMFRSSRDISIFAHMSISFFESELEEFEVGLEMKFTSIPYFQILTRNQYAKSTSSILRVVGIVFILLFVLGLLLLICTRKSNSDIRQMVDSTAPSRADYSSGQDSFGSARNKIQMKDLSV